MTLPMHGCKLRLQERQRKEAKLRLWSAEQSVVHLAKMKDTVRRTGLWWEGGRNQDFFDFFVCVTFEKHIPLPFPSLLPVLTSSLVSFFSSSPSFPLHRPKHHIRC